MDERIRYLRNVMGLWLLQESLRTWEAAGTPENLQALLIAAAELPRGGPVFDPDDPVFLPPGDMPATIAAACRRLDQPAPASRPALVRSILDSLAAAYARTVRDAARLSGHAVDVVHLVGGGARNSLLCQLTADACEVPVLAGPVEATALGNVLIQARSRGLLAGDLETLRALVRATQDIRRFEPRTSTARPCPGALTCRNGPAARRAARLPAAADRTRRPRRVLGDDAGRDPGAAARRDIRARRDRADGHRDLGRHLPRLRRVAGPRLAPPAGRTRRAAAGRRRVHRLRRRPRPAPRARPVGGGRLRASGHGHPRPGLDLVDRRHRRCRARTARRPIRAS